MDADKKARGGYIKEDGSDFLVEAILDRKEYLLQHNPKGLANGAILRKSAAEEVVSEFNRRFPGLNKSYDQLKKNFDKRRDALKKSLMMERVYLNATGGGRDPKIEADIAKLQNPSLADGLLIAYLKKSEGSLGVGDISLETGHNFGAVQCRKLSVDSDEEREPDEPCSSKVPKKRVPTKVSEKGIERAKQLSTLEFLKAARPQMLKRASELGFRKGEESEDLNTPPKKARTEVPVVEAAMSQVVNVVQRMEGMISSSNGKAEAAIAGMEQLRAAIRYAPNRPISDLQSLLEEYDAKVRSSGGMAGSSEDPISLE